MDPHISAWKQSRPAKKAKRRSRKPKPLQKRPALPRKTSAKSSQETPSFLNLKIYRPHNITFNICPFGTFNKDLESILLFMKATTLGKIKEYIKSVLTTPFHVLFYSKAQLDTLRKNLVNMCFKIRKLRGIFRRFLHRWRVSRLRTTNTEDFYTLEAPKDKIYVATWSSKNLFVFEAASVMRDITERLLHHDGLFETPQLPRNPFTNIPFTQAQIISIWIQLAKSKTPSSSVFTNFRQVRWNLYRFSHEYSTNLQLHALRKTMVNTSHIDYKERIVDFIQYCHDKFDEDCDVGLFKKIVLKKPHHLLLKLWANECTRFYEASILYNKMPHKLMTIHESVLEKAEKLIKRTSMLKERSSD